MTRGTPHGFKNVGATPGAALEIFVKQTTSVSAGDPGGSLALALAAGAVNAAAPAAIERQSKP
jgi:hypothetical protein